MVFRIEANEERYRCNAVATAQEEDKRNLMITKRYLASNKTIRTLKSRAVNCFSL